MRIHFIAIGGSAMHNLALALHHKGYHVSGSDDEIFNPSKARLEAKGLLPAHVRVVSREDRHDFRRHYLRNARKSG